MKFILAGLIVAVAVTGCTSRKDRVAFDGKQFRTGISRVDGQRQVFRVTARPVSASLAGAREAARYEATKHCVSQYGSSEIIWAVGPDSPADQLVVRNDTLTLQGTCPE